jgi:cAMP-dependent protein kinase regulator
VRDFLPQVDIFRHLSDEKRRAIASNTNLVEFDDGDTIITQGEEGNNFYIIMKGKKMMKYLF